MNKNIKLTREIQISPAFDKRSKDPKKDYGIHGCELRFVLKGKDGAVQFVLYTNWQLPHVTEEFITKPIKDNIDLKVRFLPLPADLGYHSPIPQYKDQEPMGPCEYLDGKSCYYDGSGLAAEEVFKLMLKEGSDGVWKKLENYYKETFKNEQMSKSIL